MPAMIGQLIRQERLRQNLSQEGLARGICAASYLSKIEQGQVEPGAEILERLCAALGIDYRSDPALLAQACAAFETLLECWDEDLPREETAAWFAAQAPQLLRSEAYLMARVVRLLVQEEKADPEAQRRELRELEPLLPQMDRSVRYGYCVLAAMWDPDGALRWAEEAERCRPVSAAVYQQASICYWRGEYSAAVTTADRAYRLAAEEGNAHILMEASFLLGNCYTNARDLALAERYYRRAVRLARGRYDWVASASRYNLGASFLERGDADRALHYLEPAPADADDLWHQKLALTYQAQGRLEEAAVQLAEAEQRLPADDSEAAALHRAMQQMITLRQTPGYLDDPAYERVLRQIYDTAGVALGYGFRIFHGVYLRELLEHQRKYKEALRLLEEEQTYFLK